MWPSAEREGAIAQPVVLSAGSKLAGVYLSADRRADGIALGSAGNFVGMLLALLLGPTLGGHGHLERLLVLEAVLGVLPAMALAFVLRRPGHESEEHAAIKGSAARALWELPPMRTLCGLVFLGFGIFVALATWLQTLLQPSHVSETTAGALLVGMVVAGIIGCGVLPPMIARRGSERGFMRSVVLVACGGCVVLSVTPPSSSRVPPPEPRARSCGWPATSAASPSRCSCRSSSITRLPRSLRWARCRCWGCRSRRA